jgi:hypothetical protein
VRAKLGTTQVITATAHKIARILYHFLSTKEPYAETVCCDEQAQRLAEMRLRKHAGRLVDSASNSCPSRQPENKVIPQELFLEHEPRQWWLCPGLCPRHPGSDLQQAQAQEKN